MSKLPISYAERNERDAKRYRLLREKPNLIFYRGVDRHQALYALNKRDHLDAVLDERLKKGKA